MQEHWRICGGQSGCWERDTVEAYFRWQQVEELRSWDRQAPGPAALELAVMQADFSNKNLGAAGVITITAWLIHKDNGALTMLSLEDNSLFAQGGQDSGSWQLWP
jgi:hypothetical protein